MNIVKCVDKAVLSILKVITIICFFLLTILVSANVFVRFVPVASLHWFDEIVELLYAYLVFYGSAALFISREHFSVGNWIGVSIIKNRSGRGVYRIIVEFMVLIFVGIFFYYSYELTVLAQDVTNAFAIPKSILYSCLPVSGALMIIYSIRNIVVYIMGLRARVEVQAK
ncbi:MAG TPA: TRAP transporter small permease subunit [Syntrophorhabdaceae bacterium]|nr:TRAP transporter small permease subunit [Syntrophorhabdaceae bacterium]